MTDTTLRDRAATAVDRTNYTTPGIHTDRSRATLSAWLDGAIKLPGSTARICAEYLESVADCNGELVRDVEEGNGKIARHRKAFAAMQRITR